MKKGNFNQRAQRFSIRKYNIGVASVLIASVLFMGGQIVAAEDMVSANAILQEQVIQSSDNQLVTNENAKQETSEGELVSKTSQYSEGLDISAKEESVNADKGLDSKKNQVSAEENQSEQETVGSEEDNQSAESFETATVDATALSGEAKVNQESFVREAKVSVNAQSNLPSQGYYTYSQKTEVKNEPSASAPVAFYANAGDRVFYDQVLTRDGYQWISYNSYSGQRRYAAISKLTAEVVQKLSGSLNFQNVTSQGFDILVTDVSDPKGITSVKVPVWTVKDDQDDIIWYDATRQGNGDYKVRVNIVDHKGETGTYNVHLYYQESDGHLQGVVAKQVTLPEKATGVQTLPAQGSYVFQNTVEVKNEARMSAPTEFTFEKGYKLDYYDQVLEADNHQWISYVSYGGLRRYVLID